MALGWSAENPVLFFSFLFRKSSVSLTFCPLRGFSQQDFFFSSAKHTNVSVELDTCFHTCHASKCVHSLHKDKDKEYCPLLQYTSKQNKPTSSWWKREATEGHGLPCESAKQLGCLPKLPLKNGERSQGHKFFRDLVTSDQWIPSFVWKVPD